MKYLFCLGNNTSLSMAEILAKINYRSCSYINKEVFLVEIDKKINAGSEIKMLGGTKKIAAVFAEIDLNNKKIALEEIKNIIPEKHEGKFKFGFSVYGGLKLNIKILAMELKKELKKREISCRWVTSSEKDLSTVVVGQNKLDSVGLEIIAARQGEKILLAKTDAVQDYKNLSFRDYGRPDRDSHSGMLPPKLAQIMINLATVKNKEMAVLLDPFCGSGTVLMEAVMLGFVKIAGSDISAKAVDDSRRNIGWLQKRFEIKNRNIEIRKMSALNLSDFFEKDSISCIVTEPYLGPQRGAIDLKKIKIELEELYGKTISEFAKILKSGARVVMLWPVFKIKKDSSQKENSFFITPKYKDFNLVNILREDLIKDKGKEISFRKTIVYGRAGQRVWREIVILEKE